jgi:transcriptional regulator with PAS, ATPase and Fis domain
LPNRLINEWENLHLGNYRNLSNKDIVDSWERCYSRNINPETNHLNACTDEQFKIIKKNSLTIYAYSNQFISNLKEYQNNHSMGFALFDKEGWLLKIYGSNSFLQWAKSKNIIPKTNWNEESAGTNAVSIGLSLNMPYFLENNYNFCKNLKDISISFAPLSLQIEDGENKETSKLYGGIAVIVPNSCNNENHIMTATSISHNICLHLHMANKIKDLYEEYPKGFLCIDINIRTQKPHILYHNSNIFKIFEMPYDNLYFKAAQDIFDPLPKNKDFWDIIMNKKRVKNIKIKISIMGNENYYTMTSNPYNQSNLGFQGIELFIDSSKQINSYVSKKIGNNARLTFDDIIGSDINFTNTIEHAKSIANTDSNVLILGESGVGKDIFAQSIHNSSNRRNNPFIAVNCAALPRDLIVSELFGYETGAFTGSKKGGNMGKFELADTGTIFLDEIGDMPLELQATLLRVIEQKSFMKLGSNSETNVDVRIIAATNANLIDKIHQKKFREDLYYRLTTLPLNIPPLRARPDDIILLAEHFIHSITMRLNKPTPILAEVTKDYLKFLPWKGNVRELQNLVEGIIQLYSVNEIQPIHIKKYLGIPIEQEFIRENIYPAEFDNEKNIIHKENPLEKKDKTREQVINALKINKYNKTNTAKFLGISRKTLYRWMENYNIS